MKCGIIGCALGVAIVVLAIRQYDPQRQRAIHAPNAPNAPRAPRFEPVHALNPDAIRKPQVRPTSRPDQVRLEKPAAASEVSGLRASVNVTDEEQAKIDSALDLMLGHDLDMYEFESEVRAALGPERGEQYIEHAIGVGKKIAHKINEVQPSTKGLE